MPVRDRGNVNSDDDRRLLDNRPLTAKQKAFVHALLRQNPPINNATEAYRIAYDAEGMTDAAINVEACKLKQHPKVSLILKRESDRVDALVHRDTTQQRLWIVSELTKLATDAKSDAARVRSLELLGKVRGVDLFDGDDTEESQRGSMSERELITVLQDKLTKLFPSGVTQERVIEITQAGN